MSEVDRYLSAVERHLHLRPQAKSDILRELRDHLLDAAEAGGEEARIVERFGEPARLAAAITHAERPPRRWLLRGTGTAVAGAAALVVLLAPGETERGPVGTRVGVADAVVDSSMHGVLYRTVIHSADGTVDVRYSDRPLTIRDVQ